MKGSRNENNKQSKQGHVNTPRPEIRDNLDSRETQEVSGKHDHQKKVKTSDKRNNEETGR